MGNRHMKQPRYVEVMSKRGYVHRDRSNEDAIRMTISRTQVTLPQAVRELFDEVDLGGAGITVNQQGEVSYFAVFPLWSGLAHDETGAPASLGPEEISDEEVDRVIAFMRATASGARQLIDACETTANNLETKLNAEKQTRQDATP